MSDSAATPLCWYIRKQIQLEISSAGEALGEKQDCWSRAVLRTEALASGSW